MKYTVLVNKDNKLKDNYLDKVNFIKTKNELDEEVLVEENTYNSFLKLKEYLKSINIYIDIDDSYRSIDAQQEIYNHYLELNGKDYCDKYVAIPSFSEHHTGLAIDIMLKIDNNFIREDLDLLKYSEIFEKIHSVLYKYGFILRYPKNKENITGYNYEPWHIRYVGELPAKIIYDNNLCLEEYLKDFSAILYINKPKGITSFDVVNKISRTFGIKRVGHTGTLDPLATGVLIVTVGKACKIVDLLTSKDKEYIASVELGYSTDTLDIEGNIINKCEIKDNLNIEDALLSFQKTYLQEVPIYSAVKVDGKKLYEYARENKEVDLPKKEVTIKKIELLENNNKTFKFKCLVTKGCYIRSLIKDICDSLNTLGTMTDLIRTKQGIISIDDTITLDDLSVDKIKIHNILDVLDYKKIEIEDNLLKEVSNGMVIDDIWGIDDKVIFIDSNNKLIAIYKKENNKLKSFKNFV